MIEPHINSVEYDINNVTQDLLSMVYVENIVARNSRIIW